jgi:flavin reductase (DIM6/NTAB) family NADH-FMN oxidoreductase RutF
MPVGEHQEPTEPPQGLETPTPDGRDIEIAGLSREQRYSLMNQAVVPRPIAWVVTDYGAQRPPDSRWNLAPYSYFNAVSSDPPTVVIGINNRDHPAGLKDTVRNLRTWPDFSISLPSGDAAEAVALTSEDLPWGASEARRGNIGLTWWADWSVPRVRRCRVAFACRLLQEIHLDDVTQSLLVARIHRVWLSRVILVDGSDGGEPAGTDSAVEPRIDLRALRPLARAGKGQFLEMSQIRYGTGRSAGGQPASE